MNEVMMDSHLPGPAQAELGLYSQQVLGVNTEGKSNKVSEQVDWVG